MTELIPQAHHSSSRWTAGVVGMSANILDGMERLAANPGHAGCLMRFVALVKAYQWFQLGNAAPIIW
jgi:hypothetical protein